VNSPDPYNPLAKRNLGVSVADAMLQQPISELPPKEKFIGAGIYAIYYTGEFEHYSPISEANRGDKWEQPIYVGKAIPEGGRKGGFGLNASTGTDLYQRLAKHARSINEATNLNLDDFYCRFLVVDDIWIPLGESLLIETFKPLWNRVVDGFGNNDPGKGRYNQQRSPWDVIHFGRPWAEKCQPGKSEEDIILSISKYFEQMA
jgi:hypothetical protein